MPDLKNVELMTVGDPDGRGLSFSETDLMHIANSFAALQLGGRVPLKFGHNEEQPMTDGQPALGWVARVWVEAKKLMADFTDLPTLVHTAINKKLYKFVSVELLRNVKAGTRVLPWVLDAVALLGADQPAFGTLSDLQALTMSRRARIPGGTRVKFQRVKFSINGLEGKQVEKDEVERLIREALSRQEETFNTKINKIEVENKAALKAKDDEIAKERLKAHRDQFTTFFNGEIEKGTIEANVRETFERITGLNDDTRAMNVKLEDAKQYAKDHPKKQDPSKQKLKAGSGGGAGADGEAEAGMTNAEKVSFRTHNEVIAAGGKPGDLTAQTEATKRVLKRDKDLATKYFDDPNGKDDGEE